LRTIRFIGAGYLLVAAFCALLIFANWHIAAVGGRSIRPLTVPAAAFVLVGTGLLFRRKSAALVAILGSIAVTIWLVIGSVRYVPTPGLILNAVFGGILLAAAYAILIGWRDLDGW
jgi:hypothetical protein